MVELTFLGTGASQGVPVIGCRCEVCLSEDERDKRLRSSVLVRSEGVALVIDTSMDFRAQMLREGGRDLDAVLYTHEHCDHTGGMDDLRAFNYILQRPVDIYCRDQVAECLERTFNYAFAENPAPGVPELKLHTLTDKPFIVNGLRVVPIVGQHCRIEVLGFRIGDVAYLTDFNGINPEQLVKLNGAKVLVVNALRKKPHISHYNLAQALELIAQVKPECAYLTHISHQMGCYEDVVKELPLNVFPAYDGLKVVVA